MSEPARRTSPADQQWADLAAQLTPAASLARIDTVTWRALSTVTVIGVLITGLGALAAGQVARGGAARGLNLANLAEVQAWYLRQFQLRARVTQVATVLVIVAALLAGATAVATLLASPR